MQVHKPFWKGWGTSICHNSQRPRHGSLGIQESSPFCWSSSLKTAFFLTITSAKRVEELYVYFVGQITRNDYVWIFLPKIHTNLWISRFNLQYSMKASWQMLLVPNKCPIYCLDQKLAVQSLDQLLICHRGKTWGEGFFHYSKQRLIIISLDALQVIFTGRVK